MRHIDHEVILLQQKLKGRVLHVVPDDHEPQFPISDVSHTNIAQVKAGAALTGHAFDAVLIDVPVTFRNYAWFMAAVFTRLVPE